MMATLSHRGLPLILGEGERGEPTLTVELYSKWYYLYLVDPSGLVTEIDFPDDETCPEGESPYADHVPNPRAVSAWAEKMGYDVNPLAFEMIVGRWEIEIKIRYF